MSASFWLDLKPVFQKHVATCKTDVDKNRMQRYAYNSAPIFDL